MATYSGAITVSYTRKTNQDGGNVVGGAGSHTVAVNVVGPTATTPQHVVAASRIARVRNIFAKGAGAGTHTITMERRVFNPTTSTWVIKTGGTQSWVLSFSGTTSTHQGSVVSEIELDENELLYISTISSTNGNPTFTIHYTVEEEYASF